MLSKVLPFDDDEDKEIARQTIQDAPDFSFEPWDQVSEPAKDIVRSKYNVICILIYDLFVYLNFIIYSINLII